MYGLHPMPPKIQNSPSGSGSTEGRTKMVEFPTLYTMAATLRIKAQSSFPSTTDLDPWALWHSKRPEFMETKESRICFLDWSGYRITLLNLAVTRYISLISFRSQWNVELTMISQIEQGEPIRTVGRRRGRFHHFVSPEGPSTHQQFHLRIWWWQERRC